MLISLEPISEEQERYNSHEEALHSVLAEAKCTDLKGQSRWNPKVGFSKLKDRGHDAIDFSACKCSRGG